MQRLCQTTRRCGTSKNARMRSVAAVAAGWRTEGDEDLVSTSRQLSACRHGLDKRCPVVLSVLEGLRASGQGERWLELPLMPFPWKGACSDPEFQKEPGSCVTHMSTMGGRRVGQMLVPVTFVGRSALGAQRGGAGAGRRAHAVCLAYPPGRELSPAFDRPPPRRGRPQEGRKRCAPSPVDHGLRMPAKAGVLVLLPPHRRRYPTPERPPG